MFKKLVAIEPVNMVPTGEERLKNLAEEVVLYRDIPADNAEMIRRIGDADAALISWTSRMGREVIEACPNLRYVGMCCSLYSEESANVDIPAAREHGITVTGIRDYGDPGVAEYVVYALVSYLHGYGPKQYMEKPKEITNMKVGIVGFGTTGTLIASTLKFFGAEVSYYSRTRKPEKEAEGFRYKELNDLVRESDIVCTCLNKNVILMKEEQFQAMGNYKIFFNTSIGPGHDPAALEKWLEHGDNEFFCDCPGGVGSDALMSNPHVNCIGKASGTSYEATYRLTDKVIENMENFLKKG